MAPGSLDGAQPVADAAQEFRPRLPAEAVGGSAQGGLSARPVAGARGGGSSRGRLARGARGLRDDAPERASPHRLPLLVKTFSLLIVSWNSGDTLPACVESLAQARTAL